MSKFNIAWVKLFEELDLETKLQNEGRANVSSSEIKSLTREEPRLMCKWDSRESRPEVLKRFDVTLLPTSRSTWTLLRGDGYQTVPSAKAAEYYSPDILKSFQSIDASPIGESQALDAAFLASMIRTFTGDATCSLTIRGRSGFSPFEFSFEDLKRRSHTVRVDGGTVEVDAGYEGESLWLFEAKARSMDDFIIRQLFYPWRWWQSRVKKTVNTVLLTYSNLVYGLHLYRFSDESRYQSIELVRSAWLTFDRASTVPSFEELLGSASIGHEPDKLACPFPQADRVERIIDLLELVQADASTSSSLATLREKLSIDLNIDPRQVGYYKSAALYLGLMSKDFALTHKGEQFLHAKRVKRWQILTTTMAERPVLRIAIEAMFSGTQRTDEEIADDIGRHTDLGQVTALRRAQTIQSWVGWVFEERSRLVEEAALYN